MDIGTGDFLQHFSVLSLPGSLPLTLSRFYRSQAGGPGFSARNGPMSGQRR
ncbi:DUF6531 domain-containing protein [Shigella flexneri]|uniref:DUF6531 domain-containing protein n=1 Tax=Shigella flexneri TaxID=623 RepID=UPI00254096BF|nr:DUF6531 domain-containing protein [Shigella flexneri]